MIFSGMGLPKVRDLFVQDVARDKDLVRLQVREADLGRGDLEVDLLLVVCVDVFAPGDHEGGATGALEREAGHTGEDLARGDAEIGNRTDLLAVRGVDRVAHELGQVDHSCSLMRLTPGRRGSSTPQVIDWQVEVSCGPFYLGFRELTVRHCTTCVQPRVQGKEQDCVKVASRVCAKHEWECCIRAGSGGTTQLNRRRVPSHCKAIATHAWQLPK